MIVRKKVLIVDDDPMVLKVTRKVLEAAGYEVITHPMSYGTSALILRELPDIVLLDVVMDGLPGNEIVDVIHSSRLLENRNISFVFFTGNPDVNLEELAHQDGVVGIIEKTADSAEFLRKFIKITS